MSRLAVDVSGGSRHAHPPLVVFSHREPVWFRAGDKWPSPLALVAETNRLASFDALSPMRSSRRQRRDRGGWAIQ